ncbi:MAG: ParA family protein [Bacteroidota bacterium]
MVISIQNQKGGVGKTTSAIGLADAARNAGLSILLVDLDPQASASNWLGVETDADTVLGLSDLLAGPDWGGVNDPNRAIQNARPKDHRPELHLLAADEALMLVESDLGRQGITRALSDVLEVLRPRYDLILLDGGPAITALSSNALFAADIALVPLTLSSIAIDGIVRLRRLLDLARQQGHQIRDLYVPTAADRRLRETRDLEGALHEAFGTVPEGSVLPSIRYSSALSRAFGFRELPSEYEARVSAELKRPDPAATRAVSDYGDLLNNLQDVVLSIA